MITKGEAIHKLNLRFKEIGSCIRFRDGKPDGVDSSIVYYISDRFVKDDSWVTFNQYFYDEVERVLALVGVQGKVKWMDVAKHFFVFDGDMLVWG